MPPVIAISDVARVVAIGGMLMLLAGLAIGMVLLRGRSLDEKLDRTCARCHGRGHFWGNGQGTTHCPDCNGTGLLPAPRSHQTA